MPIELTDAEPLLLRRLAVYLSEENDWGRAVALYEKALAARGQGKETATDVLLRMELGRIYHFNEKYPAGGRQFRPRASRPRPSREVRHRRAVRQGVAGRRRGHLPN